MQIEVIQMKPTIGQIQENVKKILDFYHSSNADIVLFPELALTGYIPKDTLLQQSFLQACHNSINEITSQINKRICIIGAPFFKNSKLFNAVLVLQDGKIIAQSFKKHLAKGEVFDEHRYFETGNNAIFEVNGIKIGLPICEDIWNQDTHTDILKHGVQLLLVANASPFEITKQNKRRNIAIQMFNTTKIPIIYCNQVACQDGILYDGTSFAFDGKFYEMNSFCEERQTVIFSDGTLTDKEHKNEKPLIQNIFDALIFGIQEFLHKFSIKQVIIGLSGGADSALVATLCTLALGSKNVKCVFMPSRFTSNESIEDAQHLAKNLHISMETIAIDDIFETFHNKLSLNGIARQNIQARIRGNILMSISNTTGGMVLTTGNKSEIATGYCTIYGDMCGGFNPIKDLYKTQVFELMRFINKHNLAQIPSRIIEKEPSAELDYNQKDSDSLPPYHILDAILFQFIENKKLPHELNDFNTHNVNRVWNLLQNSEYKRRQSAPGIKISQQSFERSDWRFNI